jgi:hypothetical protein
MSQDNTQSQEPSKVAPAPLMTEVTSVAKEEERTGQKVNVPSAEDLVQRAAASIIMSTKRLEDLIKGRAGKDYKISRKGMNRVLLAILSLPTEGIPVTLQGDDEKLAFALGQRLIADRFILMQKHISEEIHRQREQKAKEEANKAQTKQEGENDESKQ